MSCKHSVSFTPAQDIPRLDGKIILVTGGNIGLGKQCIIEYAHHNPAQIWLAARNLDKARTAVEEIQSQLANPVSIKILELDLSSLESVQKAARTFTSEAYRLDILMLNAGIMATPPGITKDGYELQFGTNYLGHALLAKLLLPVLKKTASIPETDVRVVAVTSDAYSYSPKGGVNFDSLKTDGEALGSFERYGQSKLVMIHWTRLMAQSYPQFTFAAIHPGVVGTNLGAGATGSPWIVRTLLKVGKSALTSVEDGAKNQLWASVSKDVKSGEYYVPIGTKGKETAEAKDDELARKVWEWTEKELEKYAI